MKGDGLLCLRCAGPRVQVGKQGHLLWVLCRRCGQIDEIQV